MRIALDHDLATIIIGDSAGLGALLPPNSVDAIVTDPPSGIAFMGKEWDRDKGGRDGWVAWLAATLAPAFAALKPGGHALVWALPRTSHWTALALELCGFEIRDRVSHLFGSGFPKSLDVSKAINARLGNERPVVGKIALPNRNNDRMTMGDGWQDAPDLTAAGSAEAAAWDGWGTALKPACEDWWLVRKPLDGTVAANVLAYGTGAINIDASRIGDAGGGTTCSNRDDHGKCLGHANAGRSTSGETFHGHGIDTEGGRWPAHVVFSHSEGCEVVGQTREDRRLEGSRAVGTAPVVADVYRCEPGCAVAELDRQSGDRTGSNGRKGGKATRLGYKQDTDGVTTAVAASKGGASRFFYCAKPAKSETEAGLDHLPKRTGGEATGREDGSAGLGKPRAGAGRNGGRANTHPTKKSIALMRYLITLITPPGGIVLDPFAGSGTTGVAAIGAGFRFVGCEQGGDDGEYVPILLGRIAHALGLPPPTE